MCCAWATTQHNNASGALSIRIKKCLIILLKVSKQSAWKNDHLYVPSKTANTQKERATPAGAGCAERILSLLCFDEAETRFYQPESQSEKLFRCPGSL
jgi:hypothetical protein